MKRLRGEMWRGVGEMIEGLEHKREKDKGYFERDRRDKRGENR